MENICSDNFIRIFSEFENKLNLIFQGKTRTLEGGSIRVSKLSGPCRYKKKLVSKDGVTIEIGILYDTVADEYLYYTYNIFFEKTKLMFHYEPTHKEHFQPHIVFAITASRISDKYPETDIRPHGPEYRF